MWSSDQSGRSEVSLSVRLSVVGKVLITDHITTSPYLPLIHTNSLPGSKLARSTRVRDRCTLYGVSTHPQPLRLVRARYLHAAAHATGAPRDRDAAMCEVPKCETVSAWVFPGFWLS